MVGGRKQRRVIGNIWPEMGKSIVRAGLRKRTRLWFWMCYVLGTDIQVEMAGGLLIAKSIFRG